MILLFLLVAIAKTNADEIDIYLKEVPLPGDIEPSSINLILPDSAGFIWIGTNTGLYRWDGLFSLAFDLGDAGDDQQVTAIAEGTEGRIWVGCSDGCISYITGREVTNWKPKDTIAFSGINDLLIDESGRVWWGTNGSGVFYFDGKETYQISDRNGLPDNYIYALERGAFNEIWAATDRGIAVCKSWEGINEVSVYGLKDGLPDDIVRVMAKDISGTLWLGFHDGGVSIIENEKQGFESVHPGEQSKFGIIDDIETDEKGIWISDRKNGIQYRTYKQIDVPVDVRFSGKIIPLSIKQIKKDKAGNVWFLSKEGLFVSSGGAFSLVQKMQDYSLKNINNIVLNGKNEYWLAEENTLKLLNLNRSEILSFSFLPPSAKITDMKMDDQGLIWLSTFGQGVVIFDPSTKDYRFINHKNDGLVNDNILSISIKGNSIWFATLGGASHLNKTDDWRSERFSIESFDKENGLGNNFIYTILQAKNNNIWFGTDGNGLARYDGLKFTFYDEKAGLGDDVVYSIDEDADGNIWLSTASSEVYKFDGSVFKPLGFPELFKGTTIFSIACLDEFTFILAETGLYILDQETENILGINEELDFRKINAELNAVYKQNDIIYFPTDIGLIKINKNRLQAFPLQPLTIVDRLMVNLKKINSRKNIELSSDQNQVVIDYTGHWYLAPRKVHYKARLKGYESSSKTTYDRRAGYASLPPGKYSFELSAYLNQSTISEKPVISIPFTILKPVYLRWWFMVLDILSGFLILYLLVKFREKRLKQSEARQKEKLEFEFQTLKNQINPHFLFNSFSTLISMIEDNPKQAVEYTDKLSDFFRNILEVKEKELIPLCEELEMLDNYVFIQQKRFGANFHLKTEIDTEFYDSGIPPLTLQLLTENAIKHNIISKSKPLKVTITSKDSTIVISNNLQLKSKPEPSTQMGIKNIKERYNLIAGKTIRIIETSDRFQVILPILK